MSEPRPDPHDDPGAPPARGPLAFGVDYVRGNKRILIAISHDGFDLQVDAVRVIKSVIPGTPSEK